MKSQIKNVWELATKTQTTSLLIHYERGDAMAVVKVGNVVEQYKIGNTLIKICDDAYIHQTKEDIERILDRITAIGWKCVEIARASGKDV